jgi:hypothetical protein
MGISWLPAAPAGVNTDDKTHKAEMTKDRVTFGFTADLSFRIYRRRAGRADMLDSGGERFPHEVRARLLVTDHLEDISTQRQSVRLEESVPRIGPACSGL